MPKIDFTAQELQDYFNEKRFHLFRKPCQEAAADMRVHADGIVPEKLLNERRPNEPAEVLEYRKKIFVAKTKPYFSKIESTLQKIRRSSDWNIRYENGAFDRIVEEENLETYCEREYPVFGSVTNWAFSLLLRQYLIDANSLVMMIPQEIPESEAQYTEPVAMLFGSDEVIDFEDGDFAVLQNKVGCMYQAGNTRKQGKSFYVVTTQWIRKYDQINGKGTYQVTYDQPHELGELPVFKVGGIVQDMHGKHIFYESRISGILPEFNEALREYSDLQAAKVLHLYPERWEYTQNECKSCKGSGERMGTVDGKPCQVECKPCNGTGYVATGPYSKIMVKPTSALDGVTQIPNPPAGFVEKDVEIIKVQEQSIQDHLYYGLAAINFEFLSQSPLAQSGVAKSMDQDGANNTVHAIAEDIVRIMDSVYRLIALYRYSAQYSADEIIEMLPKIAVPEKYDIISGAQLGEQVKIAKENKANPVILNALEVGYAGKTFNNDPQIAEHVSLVLQLDPLANISEDDKMSRLSNKGITQETYVVSSNINEFVNRAIEENSDFADLDRPKQRDIIAKYAEELMTELDEAAEIVNDVIPPDENGDISTDQQDDRQGTGEV